MRNAIMFLALALLVQFVYSQDDCINDICSMDDLSVWYDYDCFDSICLGLYNEGDDCYSLLCDEDIDSLTPECQAELCGHNSTNITGQLHNNTNLSNSTINQSYPGLLPYNLSILGAYSQNITLINSRLSAIENKILLLESKNSQNGQDIIGLKTEVSRLTELSKEISGLREGAARMQAAFDQFSGDIERARTFMDEMMSPSGKVLIIYILAGSIFFGLFLLNAVNIVKIHHLKKKTALTKVQKSRINRYTHLCMQRNYPEGHIKQALIQQGWNEEQIKEAWKEM